MWRQSRQRENRIERANIADVVGLGKSIIGSTVANNLDLNTVIIAPPHLIPQWEDYKEKFGIKGSKMIGYWSEHCPVSTSDPKVLATVYKKSTSALVSIASWADSARAVDIKIDFKKLSVSFIVIKSLDFGFRGILFKRF